MAASDTSGDSARGTTATADPLERPPVRNGPLLIAYDGTPASTYALREAAALLRGHKALVVTVYKPGLAFEFMELPTATIGVPPAPLDVRSALELDRELYEGARRIAEQGMRLAKEAGLDVEGLTVAEEVEITIAETIVDVARQQDSRAIALGAHGHGRLGEVILGSTSRDVIRHAPCPVVVARRPRREGRDLTRPAAQPAR
jgi:nucleotide-binding universal stress UspA family protein